MKSVFKNSGYLLIRFALVAVLSAVSVPLTALIPGVEYVLAVLYGFAMIYFFTYTLWFEGDKDSNRVKIGQTQEMLYKGFLSAAIVVVPICILMFITLLFPADGSTFPGIMGIIRLLLTSGAFYINFALAPIAPVWGVVGASALYIISAVCAGIGYILGYRRIKFADYIKSKFGSAK